MFADLKDMRLLYKVTDDRHILLGRLHPSQEYKGAFELSLVEESLVAVVEFSKRTGWRKARVLVIFLHI